MASATIRPGAPIWRAGRDGVGHALETARATRAACGERATDERRAWPLVERCLDCLEMVGIDVSARVAARPPSADQQTWTESELRFDNGDR